MGVRLPTNKPLTDGRSKRGHAAKSRGLGEETAVPGTEKGGRYERVSGMSAEDEERKASLVAGENTEDRGSCGAPPSSFLPFDGSSSYLLQVTNVDDLTSKRHPKYGGGHARSMKQKESGAQKKNGGDVQCSWHS